MTTASRSTAAGSPSAMTRPASMQTSRSTTCTQHVDDVLDPDDARCPRARSSRIVATSSLGLGVGQAAADLVEQQHRRVGGQRPGELEPLAVQQPEALGAPVGQLDQAAQLQHLDAPRVGAAARAARRRTRRRRARSRTPSCRRTAAASGTPARSPRRQRSCRAQPVTSCAARRTRAGRSARSSRPARSSSVVLPAPFGPDDADRLAGGRPRSRRRRATTRSP